MLSKISHFEYVEGALFYLTEVRHKNKIVVKMREIFLSFFVTQLSSSFNPCKF